MKITSFRPLIMTNGADEIGQLFEELGFVKQHEKKDVTETRDGGFRMKDAEGHSVAIAQVNQMPRDMVAVQMNVDNLEEAIELLTANGFKHRREDVAVYDTGSSRTAIMISPSGFVINVVHHVK